jgi:hypothetical protein
MMKYPFVSKRSFSVSLFAAPWNSCLSTTASAYSLSLFAGGRLYLGVATSSWPLQLLKNIRAISLHPMTAQ